MVKFLRKCRAATRNFSRTIYTLERGHLVPTKVKIPCILIGSKSITTGCWPDSAARINKKGWITMTKGINYAYQELETAIVNQINKSGLPIFAVRDMLNRLLLQVDKQTPDRIEMEKKAYFDGLEAEKKDRAVRRSYALVSLPRVPAKL